MQSKDGHSGLKKSREKISCFKLCELFPFSAFRTFFQKNSKQNKDFMIHIR